MWVLICTQNSAIRLRSLGESNHGKLEKYTQCNPQIRICYQKKKKSDGILTAWGSWENVHHSKRQMPP